MKELLPTPAAALQLLLFFLLFLEASEFVGSSIPAGLYVDNGLDQTMIERTMTKAEKHEMEVEILNLLGLPTRPRRANRNHSPPLRKSPSKFLMDIYKSLMEGGEHSRAERSADSTSFTDDEKVAIDESDMIMTFESINHQVSGVRHERGKRLWFNVTDVPIEEEIVGAELRIFQNASSAKVKPDRTYTVTAYQVVRTDQGERELELISAINTSTSYSGWLEMNLTSSFSTWVVSPDSNKGLYLSVHPVDRPGHEVRPEDIGLVTVKGDYENQPFMVGFLKTTNQIKVRTRRQVQKSKAKRVKKSDYSSVMTRSTHPDKDPQHDLKSCRIHTLYINFKDLQWQDWIIAPEGYAAYYCAGECNFPLNSHMNATNHAIVQSLVHIMDPTKFPKPCCAPTKLNPISVLYYPNESNVTLKKYKRMVVKSCGCL